MPRWRTPVRSEQPVLEVKNRFNFLHRSIEATPARHHDHHDHDDESSHGLASDSGSTRLERVRLRMSDRRLQVQGLCKRICRIRALVDNPRNDRDAREIAKQPYLPDPTRTLKSTGPWELPRSGSFADSASGPMRVTAPPPDSRSLSPEDRR